MAVVVALGAAVCVNVVLTPSVAVSEGAEGVVWQDAAPTARNRSKGHRTGMDRLPAFMASFR